MGRKEEEATFSSISCGTFNNGFYGIQTTCGCSGSNFDIQGHIFIDDFPKMKILHNEYTYLDEKAQQYSVEMLKRKDKCYEILRKEIQNDRERKQLEEEIKTKNDLLDARISIITERVMTETANLLKVPPAFDYNKKRLTELENMFNYKHKGE